MIWLIYLIETDVLLTIQNPTLQMCDVINEELDNNNS